MNVCGLCKKTRILKNSHFIPNSIYRLCHNKNGEITHPVQIFGESAISTSLQSIKPFLCEECEDRFSKNGEKRVVAECLRSKNEFLLRDRLYESEPTIKFGNTSFYLGKNILDVNSYKYFIISILWRAAATQWPLHRAQTKKIFLGEKYKEQFRKYLLGEASFPTNTTIVLFVSSNPDLIPMFSLPVQKRHGGVHLNGFYIPGIEVRLYLGDKQPKAFANVRKNNPDDIFIFFDYKIECDLISKFNKLVKKSTPKGKLAKFWNKNA